MDLDKIQEVYEKSVLNINEEDEVMSFLNEIEILNEAGGGLVGLADTIARFVMGDRQVALNQLKSLQLPDFGLAEMEPGEYNKRFQDLTTELTKALSKSVKGMLRRKGY